MHFFTVMRKNTVALNQAITYNDTQSKFIGRLRNWIDVHSVALTVQRRCQTLERLFLSRYAKHTF